MNGLVSVRSLKQTILILYFLTVFVTVVHAGITGSKHDFSGKGWGSNEICKFCHTPHNAKKDGTTTINPLWNHTVSTATYTLYASPTLDQTPVQPRGPSKLCLSCHDGTVAIDSYGNRSGSQFIPNSAQANLGTDLSNDHPISINWNHQTLNGAIPCSNCHILHPQPSYIGLPFYDHYLECATCHEPHDKGAVSGWGNKMLRKPLAQSQICLSCHGK